MQMLGNHHNGFKLLLPRGVGRSLGETLDMYLQAWSTAVIEQYKELLKECKASMKLVCDEDDGIKQGFVFRIVDQADNIYASAYLAKRDLIQSDVFKLNSILKETFTLTFIEKTPTGESEYDIYFEKPSH